MEYILFLTFPHQGFARSSESINAKSTANKFPYNIEIKFERF